MPRAGSSRVLGIEYALYWFNGTLIEWEVPRHSCLKARKEIRTCCRYVQTSHMYIRMMILGQSHFAYLKRQYLERDNVKKATETCTQICT
jgi:hypothetical protein